MMTLRVNYIFFLMPSVLKRLNLDEKTTFMLQRLGQEFLPVEDVKREGDLEAQSREESHYVPWAT
jgi:hypothetical protein